MRMLDDTPIPCIEHEHCRFTEEDIRGHEARTESSLPSVRSFLTYLADNQYRYILLRSSKGSFRNGNIPDGLNTTTEALLKMAPLCSVVSRGDA